MIPANKMIALWNSDNKTMAITKFVVMDIDKQTAATEKLPASAGACDADWLDGNPMNTPMGLFLYLCAQYGFANREATLAAAHQFREVDGQTEWAERLLYMAHDHKYLDELERK
jgi:hypothetical protein